MPARTIGTSLAAWLSLTVAMAAVVLSQLPPIRSYFDSPRIQISAGNQIYVEHMLGHIVLQPFIQITNEGDASGKVSSLQAILTANDTNYEVDLSAQQYLEPPNAVGFGQTVVPRQFLDVVVGSNSTWKNYVRFFKQLSDDDIVMIKATHATVVRELTAAPASPATGLKVISDESFGKIMVDVNRRLGQFKQGKFGLKIEARGGDQEEEVIAQSCYRFVLSDSDRRTLDTITGRYKLGHGIVIPTMGDQGTYVNLHEEDCSPR